MADEAEWKPGLPRRTLLRARARRSLTVVVAIAVMAGLAYGGGVVARALTSPNRAAAPRANGKIAFAGPNGIYMMNADGTGLRRVTHVRGDGSPSLSPDGRWIAFERFTSDHEDVYVIRSDGRNLRRLTSDGRSGGPAWSPTGHSIAFTRGFPTKGARPERIQIFVMQPDGSRAHRLSRGSWLQYETSPAWSPTGKQIAFAGFRLRTSNRAAPAGHIYVLSPGGSPHQVGKATGADLHPVWSPDASALLFVERGPQGGSISTITTAGTDLHSLTSASGLTYSPAWSPDGSTIVFARGPDASRTRLYTLGLATGQLHPLTPKRLSPANDPSWWAPLASPSPTPSPHGWTARLSATARIHVPSGITDVAATSDAIWLSGFGRMSRVDPSSGRIVATIALPGLGDYSTVAVGAGSVWTTASEKGFRGVYRIDPDTNKIVDRIKLSGIPVGVAVGGGSVWVSREGAGDVVRIDAHDDVLVEPIIVGVGAGPILFAERSVWVTNTDFGGSVSKIDARTSSVIPTWGTAAPNVEAFGAGSLWGVADNEVLRIDPRSGRIRARIPLKRVEKVTFGDGRVWAITSPRSKSSTLYIPDLHHPGTVVTIDPQANAVGSNAVPYGETAAYVDVRGNAAWVGDYNRQILTRVELDRR